VKYGNIPTNVGGKSFGSKLEAGRYSELLILEKAGKIADLQTQVPYRIDWPGGDHICKYIADFVYTDERGNVIVEDTKSPATVTPEYKLKKKLMRACHGIEVAEVYAKPKHVWPKRKIPSRGFGK
jgi:hypothetical protein